jgi:glucose-1-phosphate adenylyltransferase
MSDCDEICNMDFNEPLDFHIKNDADITAVFKRRKRENTDSANLVAYTADESGRVKGIVINPETDEEINAGINIWVVRKSFLERIVADAASRGIESWERGILMNGLKQYRIFCWEFTGYLGHISSMFNYFKTNMDLLDNGVKQDLFYKHGHIYTKVRDEAPAKYGPNASVSNSLVADGCVIEGEVDSSIIFRNVYVGKGAKIKNSIVFQSTRVEDGVQLNYIITDKDVYIKKNRVLMGYGTYPLYITKGSVV